MKEILITREVAKLLRVSEPYVRGLIRSKRIKAYKEGRRGGYRVLKKDVDEYIKGKFRDNK